MQRCVVKSQLSLQQSVVKSHAVPMAPHAHVPPVHEPVQQSFAAAHATPARVQHFPPRQSALTPLTPPLRAHSESFMHGDPGRPRHAALSQTYPLQQSVAPQLRPAVPQQLPFAHCV